MRCAVAALLAVLAAAVTGCGSSTSSNTRIFSDTLAIYSGLPLRGQRADEGRAVLRGEKLALDEVGGRVGGFDIGLIALDDTRTSTRRWDPRQTAENARQAAENPTTIAYIGDLDSGATAVSLPITNETGLLHVSPLSDYSGLTRGGDRDEPDKYYPSGSRTFARLVPTGADEAAALAGWIRSLGITRVALASDGLQEGLGQGTQLERALQRAGIDVADLVRVDPREDPPDVAAAAADLARDRAQAVVYAGASTAAAIDLLRAVHRAAPDQELFATSGVSAPALVAALPAAERRLHLTGPMLPVGARPAAARRMAVRYRRLFGAPAPPQALYGYEAMRSVLEAIRVAAAQGEDREGDRGAVIDAYFRSGPRRSVLGTYAVDAKGDTSARSIGAFVARGGRLRLDRVLAAHGG